MKKENSISHPRLLWTLVIINSTVIGLAMVFVIASMFLPRPDDELKKWVQNENKTTIEWVENNNKEFRTWTTEQIQNLYKSR